MTAIDTATVPDVEAVELIRRLVADNRSLHDTVIRAWKEAGRQDLTDCAGCKTAAIIDDAEDFLARASAATVTDCAARLQQALDRWGNSDIHAAASVETAALALLHVLGEAANVPKVVDAEVVEANVVVDAPTNGYGTVTLPTVDLMCVLNSGGPSGARLRAQLACDDAGLPF